MMILACSFASWLGSQMALSGIPNLASLSASCSTACLNSLLLGSISSAALTVASSKSKSLSAWIRIIAWKFPTNLSFHDIFTVSSRMCNRSFHGWHLNSFMIILSSLSRLLSRCFLRSFQYLSQQLHGCFSDPFTVKQEKRVQTACREGSSHGKASL